jgi:glycosyltransferase involved in cell wall biosynthesis
VARGESIRISVVMCTYNGAEFVAEQVESILAQTRPVQELVVGDDASRDETLAIVRQVIENHRARGGAAIDLVVLTRDPKEHPQPYGVAGNFARALEAASGVVVLLSDQDDRWASDRVARSIAAFDQHPDAELVHGDARLVDAEGAPLGVTLFEALGVAPGELEDIDAGRGFEAMLRRNLVTGATAAVRRELIARALPVPDGWIHDEWLAVVAGAVGRTVVLREALIDYRQHGANQIGARKLDWSTRWARLREPRTARNERLLRRARSLVDRLEALREQLDAGHLRAAREKLAHEEVRAALPASHLRRVVPVAREWRSGRYRRYGLGTQDVLRDLVQPV